MELMYTNNENNSVVTNHRAFISLCCITGDPTHYFIVSVESNYETIKIKGVGSTEKSAERNALEKMNPDQYSAWFSYQVKNNLINIKW